MRNLTENHITSTDRYIPPTRTYRGEDRQIITPTEISFHRQIKSHAEIIQRKYNELWKNICEKRKFNTDVMRYFMSHNTQLPTMYVLLKTHKFQVKDISSINDIFEKCKVRPIVSCCGSPCEKLAWLCRHILSELLNHVPSHLNNKFEHLNKLTDIPPAQLEGKKFCSGDIYDKPQCNINNCNVCTRLHEDNDCSVKAAVYCITCKLCNQRYVGETGRTIHEWLSEHLRYANNPTSNSYSDEALAQHYANFHPSALSDLSFSILCKRDQRN